MEEMAVRITVRTLISQGSEQEAFELVTFGRFVRKGGACYLRYEEFMDEGKIKTSVKFSQMDAMILRSGAVNMRLVFKQDRLMRGHYDTPYGAMETLTDTKRIEHLQISDKEGKLDLLYDFTMHGDFAGTYHMEIMYKEDVGAI